MKSRLDQKAFHTLEYTYRATYCYDKFVINCIDIGFLLVYEAIHATSRSEQ